MSTAAKKTDWANIPDDDEEDEYEEEDSVEQQEEVQPNEASETIASGEKQPEKQQVSGNENIREIEMLNFIKSTTLPKIYLNLYNISSNITENDIREFYSPLKIDKILPFGNKTMYDLEFTNREDALKVVEKGVGVIQNEAFKLRLSNKSLKPRNFDYDKRDKYDKNSRYQNQDRKGGNYSSNYDKNDTRGSHGQKRNEGRYGERRNDYGGNRKYQDETKYVKKVEEGKLPPEWEKVWEQREKSENQPAQPAEPQENQREYNNRRPPQNGKYGSKGYQNEEYKEEQVVKKGRGQTKYENEDTLEQDKILQRKDYHHQDKGGYSYRNKGGNASYENNYSSRDYKEKQGYNKDYKKDEYRGYQGRGNEDKFRSNNPAPSHKPASKEVIYVKKNSKDLNEKAGQDESPKQRKSLTSNTSGTNKTNIFNLLTE